MWFFFLCGFALLIVAIWRASQAMAADRRLQRFRRPDRPLIAYVFIPIRWETSLYTPEGAPLVREAWRCMFAVYGYGIAAAILMMIGQS